MMKEELKEELKGKAKDVLETTKRKVYKIASTKEFWIGYYGTLVATAAMTEILKRTVFKRTSNSIGFYRTRDGEIVMDIISTNGFGKAVDRNSIHFKEKAFKEFKRIVNGENYYLQE